ncbi:MAG: hypothetical protein DMG08_17720 [Acidobacteria bacterium]|nr:MAG: hypothetical protein DMG08_17720 [Acidobacteriota bacterium]PYV04794.1 MAG: hypothetical protein DMG10_06940 [Acidobacteriota bacterium]
MSGSSSRSDSERRKDKRVSLVHEIECEGEGGIFRKRVADISFGGMFIDTLTSFAPGSVIKVRFRLPGSDLPTEVNAKILYVQEKIGTGVTFLDLKDKDRDKIRELIELLGAKKRGPVATDTVKSSRVIVNIPVTLMGTELGESFEESATIVTLAKHGARIKTDRKLDIDATVFLHTSNGAEFEARVAWVGTAASRTEGEVGIQCRGLALALGFNFP